MVNRAEVIKSPRHVLDDTLFTLGNDNDAAITLVSDANSANDEVANLIEAASDSVHQGTAANSLVISNVTNDGDIQMLVSDNGDSKEFLFADGSEANLVLGHGMATATIKTASGVLTLDSGAAINIEPASGSAILLDGTISIDAGVVTGATSVTIGSTVITDGVITDSSGLQLAANLDIDGTADISGDLTLSAGADGALRFSAASSIKILDNSATALVIEEADTAYMTFVTTDSSEAIKFDKNVGIGAAPTDILHATSATASNLLTLENTNTTGSGNRNVVLKVKIAEASGGAASIYFNQGIGNGSADNMGYDLGYLASQSYFYFRSNDINGSSGDGDVWRVSDGTDDVKFLGGISTDGSTPPTSGILVGGGSIDLNNQGGLLNVGASGNDWTATTLSHDGTGGTHLAGGFSTQRRDTSGTNTPAGVFRFENRTDGDMADGFGLHIQLKIGDASATEQNCVELEAIRAGADNSGQFAVNVYDANTRNQGMILTKTGVLSVDLSGSGSAAQVDLFDQYDDATELQRFAYSGEGVEHLVPDVTEEQRLANRERMVEMGILFPVSEASSGYHMRIQPLTKLLAGGIYQNRHRMDSQYDELSRRLEAIGA